MENTFSAGRQQAGIGRREAAGQAGRRQQGRQGPAGRQQQGRVCLTLTEKVIERGVRKRKQLKARKARQAEAAGKEPRSRRPEPGREPGGPPELSFRIRPAETPARKLIDRFI